MKIWVVLEANNCETEIYISKPFYSEELARQYLSESYQDVLQQIENGAGIEEADYANGYYSVLGLDSDYYYGVVRSIDIKEV